MRSIGFFETWNKEAGLKEFSITRLQMAVFTVYDMFFAHQYFIYKGNEITFNSVLLLIVLLVGAFAPKAIKDFVNWKK
jgi:hypothetical protein